MLKRFKIAACFTSLFNLLLCLFILLNSFVFCRLILCFISQQQSFLCFHTFYLLTHVIKEMSGIHFVHIDRHHREDIESTRHADAHWIIHLWNKGNQITPHADFKDQWAVKNKSRQILILVQTAWKQNDKTTLKCVVASRHCIRMEQIYNGTQQTKIRQCCRRNVALLQEVNLKQGVVQISGPAWRFSCSSRHLRHRAKDHVSEVWCDKTET